MRRRAAALLSLFGCAACSSSPHVAVAFAATVEGQPFSCTQTFSGVGTHSSSIAPHDLRMFASSILLTGAHGTAPLILDDDAYQSRANGVALLDFEDGTGTCDTGSPATHTTITGTAPEDTYTQLAFTVGVPQAIDHVVAIEATPPLDEAAMFQAGVGYKYLKADVGTGGASFVFHLSADTCSAESDASLVCKNPNLADVTLGGWNPSSIVVFDLGALLATSDLSSDGCSSASGDPDCPPLFGQLGMAFDGTGTAGTQKVFALR